jgi:hypothetical protein
MGERRARWGYGYPFAMTLKVLFVEQPRNTGLHPRCTGVAIEIALCRAVGAILCHVVVSFWLGGRAGRNKTKSRECQNAIVRSAIKGRTATIVLHLWVRFSKARRSPIREWEVTRFLDQRGAWQQGRCGGAESFCRKLLLSGPSNGCR